MVQRCAVGVSLDSPTHEDAFWTTQPIDASALAASKLLVIVPFVALCGVASCLVLYVWGYPVSSIGMVAASALAALALLSLGVAVIASACASVTVAGLVIGSAITLVLMFGDSASPIQRLNAVVWSVAVVLLLAAGVVALVQMYRRRATDWWSRGAAMAAGAVLLLVASLPPADGSLDATPPHGEPDGVSLSIPLSGQPACHRGQVVVPFEASSPVWKRVELTNSKATLTLVGGDSVQLANPKWMHSVGV